MVTKTIKVKGGEYAIESDGHIRAVATFYGMSTDEKPVDGVNDADRYFEKDTAKVSIFDEDNKDWYPV